MGAHNLGTQIKGLHELEPVTKGKVFVSYETNETNVLSQVSLCFYPTFIQ